MAKKQKQERTFRELLEMKKDLSFLDSSYIVAANLIKDYRKKRHSQPSLSNDVITVLYYNNGDRYMVEFYTVRENQMCFPREYFRVIVVPENRHLYMLERAPLNTEDVFNMFREYPNEMMGLCNVIKDREEKIKNGS